MRLASALVLLCVPPLAAQTPCFANFDTPNFLDNWSMGGPGLLVGIKLNSPIPLGVSRIELFTGERTGSSTLAIYSHNAAMNQPLTSLGSGTFTLQTPNGWQGANMTAPIPVPANTDFWLVWRPVGGEQTPTEGHATNPPPPGAQEYRGSFDNGQNWNGPFRQHQWKLRLYCSRPGQYTVVGQGCRGSNQLVVTLGNSGVPTIGQSFNVNLSNALGGTPAVFTLGLSATTWGALVLPFNLAVVGAPGCTVYNDGVILFGLTTGNAGTATQPIPLANNPTLIGAVFFNQFFARDAAANNLGWTFTNGGRGVVGN